MNNTLIFFEILALENSKKNYTNLLIFDTPREDGWSHLAATTVDELHAFAKSIGIKREWFQDKPGFPHYDLRGAMIDRARQRGAMQVTRKELLQFFKSNRKVND